MAVKTSEKMRATLFEAAERVLAGTMSPADGRNLVGIANQMNLSVSVELKTRNQAIQMGVVPEEWGKLLLVGE